jgi:ketosteroid isomerase-like protein
MLERYRRRYADREAMGQLSFSRLRFESLDAETAIVLGRWRLQRARDSPHGRFVLVMRKRQGQWRIVVDYTTAEGS